MIELLRANQIGQVIYDSTFNADWIAGTPSIDPATGTITLAGHGLTADKPIEFDAGTGVLPAGISKYDVDILGGEFYYVINVVDDTFQISLTKGGSAVVPTDTGTVGWRIRIAGIWIADIALNISDVDEFDLIGTFDIVANSSIGASYLYPKLSYTPAMKGQTSLTGAQWTSVNHRGVALSSDYKYVHHGIYLKYRKISGGYNLFLNAQYACKGSNDKSVASAVGTAVETGSILRDSLLVSISVAANASLLRNGARFILIRRA